MRIVTVANHAGGVGKTSIALNVGFELARGGLNVLLIDMDSQGSLTNWLGVHDARIEETIYDVVDKDAPLPKPREVWGLKLIPATRDISILESTAFTKPGAIMNLRDRVEEIRGQYDLIIFDSPPTLGALFGLAAVTSDSLVIPLPTSSKGVEALSNLMSAVTGYRKLNAKLSTALVVPTMYGGRRKGDQAFLERYRQLPELIQAPVASPVPDRPAVWKDAATAGTPVSAFAPRSEAAKDVRTLAAEFARAVGLDMPSLEAKKTRGAQP